MTILSRRKLTLTGVVVLVAAFFGYSHWLQSDLPAQMPSIIGRQLKMELTAEAATQFLHVSQPNGKPTTEESKRFEEVRQAIEQLEIVSLERRGWGSAVVAKARFHLARDWLPDGQDTRYYRLQFSWINGWRLPCGVREQEYQRAWFYLRY